MVAVRLGSFDMAKVIDGTCEDLPIPLEWDPVRVSVGIAESEMYDGRSSGVTFALDDESS